MKKRNEGKKKRDGNEYPAPDKKTFPWLLVHETVTYSQIPAI